MHRSSPTMCVGLTLVALIVLGGCNGSPKVPEFQTPQSQAEADRRLLDALWMGRAHMGAPDEVEKLVAWGANVNAIRRDYVGRGKMPLVYACENGDVDAVRLLLANGANTNPAEPAIDPPLASAQYYNQHVPLELKYEISTLLVENGADVNLLLAYAMEQTKTYPLHVAVKDNQLDFVKLLLEHGAEINAQDGGKRTALDIANSAGFDEIAVLLTDNGAKRSAELSPAVNSP